ncbi:TatD family hydrolase [Treponema pedis]|uniref:TatD family hydrolase n=1 Tax=Treponema pedis TaxID=409322 RepID=UPI000409DA75|nr:TatD family hydrolase [Treponema pedis]
MYTDAHIHILDTVEQLINGGIKDAEKSVFCKDSIFCASADTASRFKLQKKICSENNSDFILSFGIHPQNPVTEEIPFLEELILQKGISAIGECGFDFFEEKYKANVQSQIKVWKVQLKLAQKTGLPMVIHCRKAMHLLFEECSGLKKVSSVIFHGWAGSKIEAASFLKKGVNAYFCIGKGLLRGQKAQMEACLNIEQKRLLTETDSPYMTLKGEPYSLPSDIKEVVKKAATIRLKTASPPEAEIKEFKMNIYENFKRAYNFRL